MRTKISCLLLSLLIYCIAYDRDFYGDEYNFRSLHYSANVDCNENISKEGLKGSISGTIDFSFSHPVCTPKEITFISSNLQLQSIVWDFGDGSIGFGSTVTHVYQGFGIYNVTLTGKNFGITESISKLIPVEVNMDNTMVKNNDTSICKGQSVDLV